MIGGPAPDERVRRALTHANINYSVDKYGSFEIVISTDDGRTQLVTIDSETSAYGSIEVRRVWSPAQVLEEAPSAKLAHHLLIDNGNVKLGAWQLSAQKDGGVAILFQAVVGADIDPNSLQDVLRFVARKADELEEQIGGDDRF